MTFDDYVSYVGTPENLRRESYSGRRVDYSSFLREQFEKSHLTGSQLEAFQWLVAQPDGPAKMLVICEDWSSDCRRDLPMIARLASETGMELRIFNRDGQSYSTSHLPSLLEAPDSNADIMAEFLNHKDGSTWQSIPVCVFFTSSLVYLYHYTEYPAIYEKDRIIGHIRQEHAGEEGFEAYLSDHFALQRSAFFRVWACAAIDEMISALHRRLLLGS
jgi:thiol-disulfide isomerase/thioredoxin